MSGAIDGLRALNRKFGPRIVLATFGGIQSDEWSEPCCHRTESSLEEQFTVHAVVEHVASVRIPFRPGGDGGNTWVARSCRHYHAG